MSELIMNANNDEVKQHWISVDDQLPENGNSCIATGFDWGKKENNRHFVVCEYFENMWVGGEGEEFKYLTHWMPLPAPPAQVAKK